jgi:membrane associated rhomboid family serine protease
MNQFGNSGNIWQDSNRFLDRFLTPVVKWIIVSTLVICVAINILYAIDLRLGEGVVGFLGMVPVKWYAIWQWVTYIFVHVDPFHWLFNMMVLFFLGPQVERALGRQRFVRFFLIAGIGAAVIRMILLYIAYAFQIGDSERALYTAMIGASGAIFAVELAFAAYYPEVTLLLWGIMPVKAKHLVVGLVVLEVFFLLNVQDNVANLAHLTGLGVGYVYLALLHRNWDIRTWRLM